MKMNPTTLPFRHQLQQDRVATVARVQRQHQMLSRDDKRPAAERENHRLRALRLGNWMGWMCKGFLFEPWMLDLPFGERPPSWVAARRFPAKGRTRGPLTMEMVDALELWQTLFPLGRKPSIWRAPFDPWAPPQAPSGDYSDSIGKRGPRPKPEPDPERKSVKELWAILRKEGPRYDGVRKPSGP